MSASRPDLSKYVVLDAPSARTDRIWFHVSERLERQRNRRGGPLPQLLAGVVALALAFVAGQLLTQAGAPSGWAQLETSGDAVSVQLQDGSRLTLQGQTKLELRESSASKVALELERGHVDCDVTPNLQRTFSVAAAGFEVRVTGTRFGVDLSRQKNRLLVEVSAGTVNIHRHGRADPEASLHAGQHWSIALLAPPATSAPAPASPVISAPPGPPALVPAAAADAGAASVAGPNLPPLTTPAESPARHAASDARSRPGARQLLDQGNAARRAGDMAEAARVYELLLSTYPGDRRAGLAAFELGRLRMDRLGDVRGAISALEQATKLVADPGLREDAMARLVRAFEMLHEQERCLEARGLYLESHPTGVYVLSVSQACGVRGQK